MARGRADFASPDGSKTPQRAGMFPELVRWRWCSRVPRLSRYPKRLVAPIREARAAAVEDDDPRERPEAPQAANSRCHASSSVQWQRPVRPVKPRPRAARARHDQRKRRDHK